jgi:hypothetical protein
VKPSLWIAKISPALFSFLVVCALAVGSLWVGDAAPAYADTGTPPAPATPRAPNAGAITRLQAAYAQEQKALGQQADNLSKANDAAAKAQAWIDTAKAKGVDTSAVEAALAAFKDAIAKAQSAHDTAAGILSTHAGFDGSGKVTDVDQARQTVTGAHQALSDARGALAGAAKNFQAALKDARSTADLEAQLTREQKALAQQQTTLGNTSKIVTQVQTIIANQKAKGQDTSALEAALAAFQQQVSTAQASNTTAGTLLSAHLGFDAGGKVTDPTQAHQTLVDGQHALQSARDTLKQAGQDLRNALQDYRDSHKPPATPKPEVSPVAPGQNPGA